MGWGGGGGGVGGRGGGGGGGGDGVCGYGTPCCYGEKGGEGDLHLKCKYKVYLDKKSPIQNYTVK